jgi:hypothetical protein
MQSRWIALAHPAAIFGVFMLAFGLVYTLALNEIFDRGEPYAEYVGQIEIVSSRLEFGTSESGPTVAVIGRARNTSAVDWRDFVLHVEFQNADGELSDAGQELEYGEVLPAGEELAFKVSLPREFPESAYIKHLIRIVSARDARSRWF